jgi:hypothetical protein
MVCQHDVCQRLEDVGHGRFQSGKLGLRYYSETLGESAAQKEILGRQHKIP